MTEGSRNSSQWPAGSTSGGWHLTVVCKKGLPLSWTSLGSAANLDGMSSFRMRLTGHQERAEGSVPAQPWPGGEWLSLRVDLLVLHVVL